MTINPIKVFFVIMGAIAAYHLGGIWATFIFLGLVQ